MKKGGIFTAIIIVLLIIIIATVGAVIYFYNFHVFKTVRICLAEEGEKMNLTCENTEQCRGFVEAVMQDVNLTGAPAIIKNNFDLVFDKFIYCDEFCFIRNPRGFNPVAGRFEFLESCNNGEIEIAFDIRGKDAIATFNWLKG